MNEFLRKFQPIDLIAIIIIIGCLYLLVLGVSGEVGAILSAVVMFYFGKKEVYDPIKTKFLVHGKTETVETMIKRVAREEGIDPYMAVRVAKCESGLNPAATNKNSRGSIDRGLFQWNDRWHPEISDACAFNGECATRAFCKAFRAGHLDWWNASKKCWNV